MTTNNATNSPQLVSPQPARRRPEHQEPRARPPRWSAPPTGWFTAEALLSQNDDNRNDNDGADHSRSSPAG